MYKISALFLLLIFFYNLNAQNIRVESNTLTGSKQQLPFWLWANQLGRYDRNNDFLQHFAFNGDYTSEIGNSGIDFTVVSDLDILLGDDNSIRFTELYGEINWKSLQIKGGAFAEQEKYQGLSASNGNMANTRNARPHPALRIGFNRFVPVLGNWFSVYGFYEEGLLNDSRYVKDTHLHHKALYFRFGNPENLSFSAGLEHFVMWGGTHPVEGKLPRWSSYIDYMLGRSGGEDALPTDQINVLGNQYGTYQVEIKKEWQEYRSSFYISHPFEDRSGLELDNYRDNIYGLFIQRKKPESFVNEMLVEYYYTKNQSGAFHLVPQGDGTQSGRGRDNYFNHGVYLSGVTYEQFTMASPFFSPVIVKDGISKGLASTRFSGFHFGASGNLTQQLTWQALASRIKHFGQYNSIGHDSYQPPHKQFSTMLAVKWLSPEQLFAVKATIAADHGSVFDNGNKKSRLGAMISFSLNIR